jgi:predicted RND superfamily exporter protein
VLAVLGASRLHFDPDLLNLIPQNNREVNEFRRVLKDLGTLDNHVVVMNIPKGVDINTYDSLIESVANGYKQSKRIEDVQYRIPNPLDFVELILPRAMLFLTPEELDQVAGKLTDESIRESVARNRTLLQTPQSFALKQLVQYDPFNLAPIFLHKFESAGGGFHIDTASGYYLSSDRTMLLILAKPKRPAQDVPFAKELLAEGSIIEARALAEFQKNNPGVALPTIEHTGGYQIAVGDADLIRGDVIINILGSFFGVLALFIYAFRRGAALLYGALPMSLALALTFGIAGVTYGQLSSASAGFAALLAGLGIDFITVLYGRYVDERNRGATMAHGLITAMRASLPGIIVAALTTAATFYAFLATDFRGMTQLGFLTGSGILFFLAATAILLPALIVLTERREESKRAPRLVLHSFGSHHLINGALRRPKATIWLWVAFTVLCAVFATRLKFSDNIQDLRAKGNTGVVNQEKVTKKFGQSFEFMMYVIHDKSLDTVISRTHAVADELKPMVSDKTIGSYQSIATFVPPIERQRAVIRTLEAGRADRFNFERISATFHKALEDNGFKPEAYDHYMELFAQTVAPKEPITIDTLSDPDLVAFTSRFVKKTSDGWMSVTYVYPSGGKWPREVPEKLLALDDNYANETLTGINLVSSTLRRIVKADATRATIIGVVAVAIIMLISFRRIVPAALTFVPFIAGLVAMLGLMALLGLQFNFMNIFVGLMIIGCGTDYAVYILHRFIEAPQEFGHTATETGKAVVMAALTTVLGYGSFALSHYPGLRSIGYASFFGIFFSGLAAITLLPAILMVMHRNGRERE